MKSAVRNVILIIVLTILLIFGSVQAHSTVQVTLPDTSGEPGDTVAIPIFVSEIVTGDSILSFQMTLTFDSGVLIADTAYTTGTITQGWGFFLVNATIPGEMHIAIAGAYPLSGSGVLVYGVFIVNGFQGDTTTIHFSEMRFNDDPADTTDDGLFKVGSATDVGDENEFPGQPNKFTLFQNYPNPFNPQTEIGFAVPVACRVEIAIYNVAGQLVKTLVDDQEMRAGTHTVRWDCTSSSGEQVASGIYFYKMIAGDFSAAKKMVITK